MLCLNINNKYIFYVVKYYINEQKLTRIKIKDTIRDKNEKLRDKLYIS